MKARVAGIAGSLLALTVIGGFAAASTFQSAPVVAPVVVATVEPTETATIEPVVVPTTVAPVPVESTTAPAPVVAPTSEAPVAVKSPAPAPVVRATVSAPRAAGTYPDGSPFKYDSLGRLIEPDVAPAPGYLGNGVQSSGANQPTPTPTK